VAVFLFFWFFLFLLLLGWGLFSVAARNQDQRWLFFVAAPAGVTSSCADVARTSMVALTGSLAKHLAVDDARVGPIVDTLLAAVRRAN
jgi:hypothetical protein